MRRLGKFENVEKAQGKEKYLLCPALLAFLMGVLQLGIAVAAYNGVYLLAAAA